MIKDGKPCFEPMKDKCDAIRNMLPLRTVKECRQFWGMVNFLSKFLPKLRKYLIPIYALIKKKATFKWTDECQKSFNIIKDCLQKPPVLRMPAINGIFHLESDTSREAAGGTLYQWQDDQWVLIGYHSKRLSDAIRNYGVCELELTGLVCNIHSFEHLLKDNYFEVIIDHKAIEYLKRAKYQPTTRRLGSLLLKLQDYAFDIKYLEGAKLKVSDALSRLYIEEKNKITDVIPLNFLLHTEEPFIHLQNIDSANELYAHKTITTKYHPQIQDRVVLSPQRMQETITNNLINPELKILFNINSNKEVITSIKDPDNGMLVKQRPVSMVTEKITIYWHHIPCQVETDRALAEVRSKVIRQLVVNFEMTDLIREYDRSVHFKDIYSYIAWDKLSGSQQIQRRVLSKSANYIVANKLLFKLEKLKEGKEWYYHPVLVIPEKLEANIFHMYHNSLFACHQGLWKTFLTIRNKFFVSNLFAKLRMYIEACSVCQSIKPKQDRNKPYYGYIPKDYLPLEHLAVDIKYMPDGFDNFKYIVLTICEHTNFVFAIHTKERDAQSISDVLIHLVFTISGLPQFLSVDKDRALARQVITTLLQSMNCSMQIISPWNHGSSKAKQQIQTIGNMITKHLIGKGMTWPLYASVAAYAMNTFASKALQGFTPFELVFVRKPQDLSSVQFKPFAEYPIEICSYVELLMKRVEFIRTLQLDLRNDQNRDKRLRNEMFSNVQRFIKGDIVYALAPSATDLEPG